ncbi:MAG: hypothetical protein AAGA26_00025 [Pseudomonadota bacterium]
MISQKSIASQITLLFQALGLHIQQSFAEKIARGAVTAGVSLSASILITTFCAWYGAFNFANAGGFRAPTEYKPFVTLMAFYNFAFTMLTYAALTTFYITFLAVWRVSFSKFASFVFRLTFPIALILFFKAVFDHHNFLNTKQYIAFVDGIASPWLRSGLTVLPFAFGLVAGIYVGRKVERYLSVFALPPLVLAAFSLLSLNHEAYAEFLARTGFGGGIEQTIMYKDNMGNCNMKFEGRTLMRTSQSIFSVDSELRLYEFRISSMCGLEYLSGVREIFDPLR